MDPVVAEALQQARYSDTVQLSIEGQNIALAADVDPESAAIQWNRVENEAKRYLSTKKWMFPMLNDTRRNNLYEEAIKAVAKKLDSQESVRVLDIGAGTGLLGMMAAKHLPGSRSICLEMSSTMATMAQHVIWDNDFDDQITVVNDNSRQLPPLEPKANLCVSELLESGLLGEGWLSTMRDAWDRHLTTDAVVVPQKARVYVQLVQGEWLRDWYGPHDNTVKYWHPEGQHLAAPSAMPMHVAKLVREGRLKLLSKPEEVFEFDCSTPDAIPGPEGRSTTVCCEAYAKGTVCGALVWWDLELCPGVVYSMDPREANENWQNHWHQMVHIFEEKNDVDLGDTLELGVSHDDSKIRVQLAQSSQASKRQKRIASSSILTPFRANQLNNVEWTKYWKLVLQESFEKLPAGCTMLDVSDFGWCACLAASSLGAKHVISVESSFHPDLTKAAALVAQMGNSLPREGCHFEVLQCSIDALSLATIGLTKPVDMLISDTYNRVLEGWHIQEAFLFHTACSLLQQRGVISSTSVILPTSWQVCVMAIECNQLANAYTSKDTVAGFNHTHIVEQAGGGFCSNDLCIQHIEYDHKSLTAECTVLDTNFGDETDLSAEITLPVTAEGTFHAVSYWVTYNSIEGLCPSERRYLRFSPGPQQVSRKDSISVRFNILGNGKVDIVTSVLKL